jgi:periplasmic copper chaperone A
MRKLLVALNVLLILAILGVAFFWHPEPAELPLPGTYAEKLGRDIPVIPPAGAPATTAEGIVILDPYVPLLPPGVRTGAAYLRIRNAGERDMTLVTAFSPAADVVELHTHVDDAGVLRMRQVKEIVVPARGEVMLQPGGYHVMLIGLPSPLLAGDKIIITLSFADGSGKTVEAIVR